MSIRKPLYRSIFLFGFIHTLLAISLLHSQECGDIALTDARKFYEIGQFDRVFTTLGPVTNMNEVFSTMKIKSVIAGEYTAPPAHGPMIAES